MRSRQGLVFLLYIRVYISLLLETACFGRGGAGQEGLSEGSSRKAAVGKAVVRRGLSNFLLFVFHVGPVGRSDPTAAGARRKTPKGDIVLAIYTSRTHTYARVYRHELVYMQM